MKLIGKMVIHQSFGKGKIIAHENQFLTVQFEGLEEAKKFCYPQAFDQFMKPVNESLAIQVANDARALRKLKKVETWLKDEERELSQQSKKAAAAAAKKGKKASPSSGIKNIAIKCTYCDGGSSEESMGFKGVCSDSVLKHNIQIAKRVWCSQPENKCNQYFKGNLTRQELDGFYESTKNKFSESVCYESQMLQVWATGAGFFHHGERAGKPMKLIHAGSNSLALLTTRMPYASEDQRLIFAVFLVHENYAGDDWEEGYIGANPTFRIQLSPEEAEQLKFWEYYFNPAKPEKIAFGSGLHRYLTDEQGAQVLKKVREIKTGTQGEKLADDFLKHYCELKGLTLDTISTPQGPLAQV